MPRSKDLPDFPKRRQQKSADPAALFECAKTGQAENDEPQPQVVVAFGFLITNCAPSRSSL